MFDPRSSARLGKLQREITDFEWTHERDVTGNVKSAIRRRMTPGSFFREEYARKRIPLRERIIGGAHYAGADFIGHRDALSGVLELARIRPGFVGEYESYRHHLARRAQPLEDLQTSQQRSEGKTGKSHDGVVFLPLA
ncbi:hypothetical protein C8D87_105203 [Lentzea atacamensis]|uniref:Uncharacterized protein n=1 Tax=Lentzea atacamensis TaxID=531938 RepID=A0ABX9E5U9_9PSEU|nr:hypothetical protein [Lentzea atacamensis]RAS64713.1 hypothetical protein C8D87_105203 [Lentzea atacamensis]